MTTEGDIGGVLLTFKQYPFRVYLLVLLALMAVGGVWMGVNFGFLVVAGMLLGGGSFMASTLDIEIKPARARLSGWTGRVPLPASVELEYPVRVTWKRFYFAKGSNRGERLRTWRVIFESGGTEHQVDGVQCTEEELYEIERQLARVSRLLEDRQGLGELEIPVELREVVRVSEDGR